MKSSRKGLTKKEVFLDRDDHYGPLASEFYQLTKDVDGAYPDISYYAERLADLSGRKLEIGVGTGRLLIPLLQEGIEIEGMDSSLSMLEHCKKNLKDRKLKAELHHQNALEMNVSGKKFSSIIISFGSFQIFSQRSDAIQVLKVCASHLLPGGKLFVDLDIPKLELDRAGIRVYGTRVQCEDSSHIVIEGSKTYSVVNQIESIQLRYERWKNQKLIESELQFLDLRWYSQFEFRYLLEQCGFELESFCVDYDESLTTAEDYNQVLSFVAKKPRV